MSVFAESNHDGDKQTRRSETRFMMHMNISLINWYSNKKSIKETSVLCAEFPSMNVKVESLCAIQYKLRMISISISEPSYIFGDSMLVFHNS